ncbi:MAG TPA: hypothetical protein VGN63_19495 [Flavisolibacter sp.]|jgi:hypothetical protein|nr:hypothetical protein [Flavisolibacter sp.]
MVSTDNIKSIKSLSGVRSEQNDEITLDRWRKEGRDLQEIFKLLRQEGEKSLLENNAFLFKLVNEANDFVDDDSLTLPQLKAAHLEVLKKIKRVKEIIDKSRDIFPEASAFVIEMEITYQDGKVEVINEGVNNKILDLYKTRLKSLQDCATFLDKRIEYASSNSNSYISEEGITDNVYSLETAASKMIYLQFSGILSHIVETAIRNNPKHIQNNKTISRIIAHLCDENADNIYSMISKTLTPHIKDRNNSPYKNPKHILEAIEALNEDGFDTTELYEFYLKVEKEVKN